MWYRLILSFLLCFLVFGCHSSNKKITVGHDKTYDITGVEKAYFAFDKSDVRELDEKILRKVVQSMHDDPSANILLVGHTDARGTEEYNMALGERRAESVRKFIIKCDPSLSNRITTQSKGKTEPEVLVDVSDRKKAEEAHAKNRRVVISIDKSDNSHLQTE